MNLSLVDESWSYDQSVINNLTDLSWSVLLRIVLSWALGSIGMVARLFDRIPLRRWLLDWFGRGEDCIISSVDLRMSTVLPVRRGTVYQVYSISASWFCSLLSVSTQAQFSESWVFTSLVRQWCFLCCERRSSRHASCVVWSLSFGLWMSQLISWSDCYTTRACFRSWRSPRGWRQNQILECSAQVQLKWWAILAVWSSANWRVGLPIEAH